MPSAGVEARVEHRIRVRERGTFGEGDLHLVLRCAFVIWPSRMIAD
jgi:hypothetical protein